MLTKAFGFAKFHQKIPLMFKARWLFAALLFNCFACRQDRPAPKPAVTTIDSLPPLDSVMLAKEPDPFFLKKYVGKVGNTPNAELMLINWGDGFLSGRYSTGAGKLASELSGELRQDSSFELFELVRGKENAVFKGKMGDPTSLEGSWQAKNKKTPLPVSLQEVVPTPSTDPTGWSGNWHLNQVWDNGFLMIGNVDQDSFDFALSVSRGSHIGTIEGRAALEGRMAVFNKADYDVEPCVLKFWHEGGAVRVEQPSTTLSCGFGARAHAGGRYERQNLVRLTKLKVGNGEGAVFDTKAAHDTFRKLVGDETYEKFALNMQQVEHSRTNDGKVVVSGTVPGFLGSHEAVIMYSPQGKIWAATLDFLDENDIDPVIRYFTNDPAAKQKLPNELAAWKEGFKDYRVVF